MSRRMSFSKEYQYCPLDGNEHLNLTLVESQGRDLDEMLDNVMIYLEDWHGNQGPDWDFGSLPQSLQDMVTEDIMEYLRSSAETRGPSVSDDLVNLETEQTGRDDATASDINEGNPWNR